MTKISIIIVAYKNERILEKCLESLPTSDAYEVIVINNSDHNRGFAKACNLGAKQARGKVLFFLNPDTIVTKKAIDHLYHKLLSDPQIGIIGPQLINQAGDPYLSYTKQSTYISSWVVYSVLNKLFPGNRYTKQYWYQGKSLSKERRVESISGAAMMIKRDYFLQIGGFDERFFMYWEDADLCRRVIQDNRDILYYPQVNIMHQKAGSTPSVKQAKRFFIHSRFVFFIKQYGLIRSLPLEAFLRAQENWKLALIIVLSACGVFYVI